ncbi:cell division control protein 42 homolog [Pecten maximus]|uniref:cell division control protein 42 homolog n=1 Tax=Pecten maximus TaxID=6579 RepID=UPI0014588530|nr:cell division control protein 42 homolog [Pecten maximus]
MVILRTNFIKCVVIGDDAVGKTSMLVCYATNKFPETQHLPSVFDNYAGNICISGKRYHLQLIDTLEQDPCSDVTQNVFPGTDVFVVCFSAVRPESFNNAEKKWIPIIKKQMGDTPFILVNTQTDLRKEPTVIQELRRCGRSPISKSDGAAMARRLGASTYIECSPDDQKKMKQLINNAIVSVLSPVGYKIEGQTCNIL